jgi:hypothetical protein
MRWDIFCAVRAEVMRRHPYKRVRVSVRWLPAWDLVVRQLPASKGVNTETEETTTLKAVTRRQPVKIQQTEET